MERLLRAGRAYCRRAAAADRIAATRPRNDWLDMNYEAASYFSRRYRAIRALTSRIEWQVGDIFTLERAVEKLKQRDKFKKNSSPQRRPTRSSSISPSNVRPDERQNPMPHRWSGDSIRMVSTQSSPKTGCGSSSIRSSSAASVANPSVRRVSSQAIDLSDVATLMPVFRQDRGSLVGPYDSHRDLAVTHAARYRRRPPRSPHRRGRAHSR